MIDKQEIIQLTNSQLNFSLLHGFVVFYNIALSSGADNAEDS